MVSVQHAASIFIMNQDSNPNLASFSVFNMNQDSNPNLFHSWLCPDHQAVPFSYKRLMRVYGCTPFWSEVKHTCSLDTRTIVSNNFLKCLIRRMLSRNVGNFQPTLLIIPEERRSHSHRGVNTKSCNFRFLRNLKYYRFHCHGN